MKQIFDPVLRTANDLSETARRITDDGIRLFRSSLGKLPLLSSVRAIESSEIEGRDETHYFLVPFRLSESGYTLFTQRVLPEGTAPENILPKARVFHLPQESSIESLETLITDQLKENNLKNLGSSALIADRLDMVAEEIDSQSNLITGGLVVIGGVVAVVNPLMGVGIAAKAILPTLGSKLSKHGINHLSDWLRDKKQQSNEKTATADAIKEIKRLPAEIEISSALALLEETVSTKDPSHDPNLAFAELMNSPQEASFIIMAAEAISCTYAQCLESPDTYADAKLHPVDVTWIRSLADLVPEY